MDSRSTYGQQVFSCIYYSAGNRHFTARAKLRSSIRFNMLRSSSKKKPGELWARRRSRWCAACSKKIQSADLHASNCWTTPGSSSLSEKESFFQHPWSTAQKSKWPKIWTCLKSKRLFKLGSLCSSQTSRLKLTGWTSWKMRSSGLTRTWTARSQLKRLVSGFIKSLTRLLSLRCSKWSTHLTLTRTVWFPTRSFWQPRAVSLPCWHSRT